MREPDDEYASWDCRQRTWLALGVAAAIVLTALTVAGFGLVLLATVLDHPD